MPIELFKNNYLSQQRINQNSNSGNTHCIYCEKKTHRVNTEQILSIRFY